MRSRVHVGEAYPDVRLHGGGWSAFPAFGPSVVQVPNLFRGGQNCGDQTARLVSKY
jgi:hypothetical protein